MEASGRPLDAWLAEARRGKAFYLPTGWYAELAVPSKQRVGVPVRNVIGYWPGVELTANSQVVMVTAYYDGLGRFPEGTLYPGANDNASGVATMLEMIRTLKEEGFKPKRTLFFVAWMGGERHRPLDFSYFLRAGRGFEEFKIVAALELEGVGAGTGSSAVAWHSTRERLTEVVRRAARQVHTPLTTKARGLHADSTLWSDVMVKDVPALTLSWVGSDDLAHRPSDTPENIDPQKLEQVGRLSTLALMILANDLSY